MPDAYASFVNQSRGYSCSYTIGLGTAPGVCTITAPPDFGRIDYVGPLSIYYMGKLFMRLKEARLTQPSSPTSTTQAPAVRFQIEDRRWKWAYGQTLDGDYNVLQKDGTLLREKNPQELATIILSKLGENGVDVSALPSDARPRIHWEAADAREELDSLCGDFGCAPGFNPFTDRVYIVKLGFGSAPPQWAHKSRTDARRVPARPDAVRIIGGKTKYQTALLLGEYVGYEVDGTLLPIDQLSYKPAAGWLGADPETFSGLLTSYVDPATGETLYHRELAKKSVFRCLRIVGQSSGGFSPDILKGKPFEPKSIKDLGPFSNERLEKDIVTGERMPAYVRGVFASPRYGLGNSPVKTRYHGSVSINSELRIVTFNDPIYKFDANTRATICDDLELICAYEVSFEGVPIRYENSRAPQGQLYGAGEHRVHHHEIVREIIEKKASATGKLEDNLAECDKQANYYLGSLTQQYDDRPSHNIEYSGLEKFSPDGRIRSVTWSFSTTGTPATSVAWDCEKNSYQTPWEERAEFRAKRIADAALRKANGRASVAASQHQQQLESFRRGGGLM